jgi:acetyltransferase
MTIQNLDYLFKPNAIALVCSGDKTDVVIARNLMNAGFSGPVMPVDTTRPALEGAITYASIAHLPLLPDLVVIAKSTLETPDLISELGKRGVRAAVIVGESKKITQTEPGKKFHQAIRNAAAPYLLRVLGPGCRELKVPAAGLNASLSQFKALPGHAGFVTQSSGIAQAAQDWSMHHGFGFSYLINLGAEVDVDIADALDYLANDYRTRAILLYLEHITHPRKFMSAARRAARIKPVIVLKPQRYDARDDGEDAVYSAAFRRAGILRVDDRHELFNLVEALPAAKRVNNDRLAIVSNSRSLSTLAASTLYQLGGRLAQFSEETQRGLENLTEQVHAAGNPVDLGSRATADSYGAALDLLSKDRGIDGILVIKAPSALSKALPIAEAIIARLADLRCCLLASFPGLVSGEAARRCTMANQVPTYETSNGAVGAFMRMVQYKRNQRLLKETPPSLPEAFTSHPETARNIITQGLAAGRERLNEFESMQLLAAYGIPVVETHRASDPAEACQIAAKLGRSVAIKILSPAIPNKVQVGGVARYLDTPEAVRTAASSMLVRLQDIAPAAELEGFLIQPMEYRDGAYELTLGVRPGGPFGPVIYFGHGGTEAEVIDDIGYGLAPLNMHLAHEMMAQTRIYQRLRYSLLRRVDLDAVALTLVKISQMVVDLGELVELDINPLRANAQGVLVLDAQVGIAPYSGDPAQRLAIRPYPNELEERITLSNGLEVLLRPVLPEDEPGLQGLVQRTSPEDLRLRFFQPIRALSHDMAAALTQIDYNREMALVAVGPGLPGKATVYGMANLSADPDNQRAEYSIIVDRELMRCGLGMGLMRRIIDYGHQRNIREIYGEVLQENEAMLELDKALGFSVHTPPDDPGLRHVTLRL